MNISKSTIAALIFASVGSVANADNFDVLNELTARPTVASNTATLTRAEVNARFMAARAAGDLTTGENGETARELNPRLYAAHEAIPLAQQKTREEVRKEFLAARAAGAIVTGENGETARELDPHLYPAVTKPAPVSSEQTAPRGHGVRAADRSYYGI